MKDEAALDAPVDLRDLLAHDGWLRALARGLVRDPERGDDVAQDAWVEALERPPARVASVRGWLGRVARNRARLAGRSEARRRELEARRGAPAHAEAAGAGLERAALHRDVADGVLALDEPYRTALLLRYFEGLPPREIARRLDVPVATVRTRVARGLERLRERLDARRGGREQWLPALAPLAARGAGALAGTLAAVSAAKLALGACAAAAAALVGARVLAPDAPSAPPPPLAKPDAAAVEVAQAPERADEEGTTEPRAAAPPSRREVASVAPAAAVESASGRTELALRVVRAADGSAVPGARVRIASAAPVEEELASLLELPGLLEERLAWSDAGSTDGGGHLRLPEPAEPLVAVAEAPGLFGAALVAPGAEQAPLLALREDADVDVRVVRASGEPVAGARVTLRLRDFRGLELASATTETDGTARLRHALNSAPAGARDAALAVEAVLARRLAHALDLAALPREPVELALPATGEVELVLDWRRGALPADATASVAVDPESDPILDHGMLRGARGGPLEEGRLVLPHVELGLRLAAHATLGGFPISELARFAGPVAPGERVTVRLAPLGIALLSGRLVDLESAPLADADFAWTTSVRRGESTTSRLAQKGRTDERGSFSILLVEAAGERPDDVTLHFTHERGGEPLGGFLAPAHPLADGPMDVGDVVLAPFARVATGIVLDEGGRPVAGAKVRATPVDAQGRPEWTRWQAQGEATSDGDGRFELRAAEAAERVSLRASTEDSAGGEAVVVGAGARDVVLRIRRGASVAGRLDLGAGVPVEPLRLELRPARGSGRAPAGGMEVASGVAMRTPQRRGAPCPLEPDGSFRSARLEPGAYDLVLVLGQHEVLDLGRAAVLAAGENDLGTIPVPPTLRALEITLVDEDGWPVQASLHRWRPAGSDGPWNADLDVMHRSTVVTTAGAVEVWADAPDRRSAHVARLAEDRTLVLPAAERVLVVLRGGPPELPASCDLGVELVIPDAPQSRATGWFGAEGTAEVAVARPGALDVQLVLRRRAGWTRYDRLPPASGARIVVPEDAGGRAFEIGVDPEALAELASRP